MKKRRQFSSGTFKLTPWDTSLFQYGALCFVFFFGKLKVGLNILNVQRSTPADYDIPH